MPSSTRLPDHDQPSNRTPTTSSVDCETYYNFVPATRREPIAESLSRVPASGEGETAAKMDGAMVVAWRGGREGEWGCRELVCVT